MGRTHRWSNRLYCTDHRAADDVHSVRASGTYCSYKRQYLVEESEIHKIYID